MYYFIWVVSIYINASKIYKLKIIFEISPAAMILCLQSLIIEIINYNYIISNIALALCI